MLYRQLNYGLYLTALLAFTGTYAFPSLEARKTVSTDGTCSSTITCVGSKFGDCCSQYGYCGSTPAHCGTGTSSGSGTQSNVTSDGTCGKDKKGLTCQGSTFGNCCSAYGYCGSTSDHCGTGCQTGYGTCGSSSSSGPSSSPSSSQSSNPSSTRTTTSTATSASAATSAASATAVSICNSKQNSVQNPSFEDGLSPWTATGGTIVQSNGQDKTWGFAATSGNKYIQLESSAAHPNSSVTQSVSIDLSGYRATLSFDWAFMVSTTSRGPPSTKCTLLVQWGYQGFYTLASWTRPGSSGGAGHEETTFDTGIGSGDLVFSFACTSTNYNSGLMIDNVQMIGC